MVHIEFIPELLIFQLEFVTRFFNYHSTLLLVERIFGINLLVFLSLPLFKIMIVMIQIRWKFYILHFILKVNRTNFFLFYLKPLFILLRCRLSNHGKMSDKCFKVVVSVQCLVLLTVKLFCWSILWCLTFHLYVCCWCL